MTLAEGAAQQKTMEDSSDGSRHGRNRDTLKVETASGLGYFQPEVCTGLRKTWLDLIMLGDNLAYYTSYPQFLFETILNKQYLNLEAVA